MKQLVFPLFFFFPSSLSLPFLSLHFPPPQGGTPLSAPLIPCGGPQLD